MLTKITKKYLKIPVRAGLPKQFILFYRDGKLVYDLKAPICMNGEEPTCTSYINLERFQGEALDIVVDPETDLGKFREIAPGTLLNPVAVFPFEFSDTMDAPDLYKEPWRPRAHFTVPVGHNNDINGFCYYQGKYHIFCQHNPVEPEWGNMHWYHTVSTDMVHWKKGDDAMFPDERGMVYSGCGFIDEKNSTGLGTEGHPAMLLIYTAAACRTRLAPVRNAEQCIAYTLDGKTFTKYEGNPILPRIGQTYNRDPKVVWVEEIGKYVMALFLSDGGNYMMLTSPDLIHWEQLTEFRIGDEEECPEIYPMWYEGKKYWVLMGIHDKYVLAHFTKDGQLSIDTEPQKLTSGRVSYASQTCAGMPGNRVVRIAWHVLHIPGPRISSQFGIPVEMRLEPAGTGLQLCALPAPEYESLRKDVKIMQNVKVDGTYSLPARFPCEMQILADYDPDGKLKLEAFGWTAEIDMAQNGMAVTHPTDVVMPLSHDKKLLKLRIFFDAHSVEVFADDGRYSLVASVPCWQAPGDIRITAEKPVVLREIDYYRLEDIWENK